MTFNTRFLLLALVNCALMLFLFFTFSTAGADMSERLIDLDLSKMADRNVFIAFIIDILVSFVVNFLLLFRRKSQMTIGEARVALGLLQQIYNKSVK
jgi:putative flippase GtrA